MDVGFHYYIVYLLGKGLGMDSKVTDKIAYSSQHVDDNVMWTTIDKGLPTEFPVVATFSIDIAQRSDVKNPTLLTHFPPGDGPDVTGVERADGKWFAGITTPRASMAETALDKAIESQDPYQIGAALHTFADSWAHQGFAGCQHEVNKFPGSFGKYQFLPRLGHGQAGHYPDWPVIWEDKRRVGEECRINNKVRFREAATVIAEKLDRYVRPMASDEQRQERITPIIDKIFTAFGEPIPVDERKEGEIENLSNAQINSFRRLGLDTDFGGEFIEAYDPDRWTRNILHTEVRGLNDNWLSRITLGLFTGGIKDKHYWQPTYYEGIIQKDIKKHPHSSPYLAATSLELESFPVPDSSLRYYSSFPASGVVETWPQTAQDISKSPLFQFHVAAQTHLAYLIDETQNRIVPAKNPKDPDVSLYNYYDGGKVEPWVRDLKKRTLTRRQAIYGDEE